MNRIPLVSADSLSPAQQPVYDAIVSAPNRGGRLPAAFAALSGIHRQVAGAGADAYPKWLLDHHLVTTGRGLNSAPIAEFVMANIWPRRNDSLRLGSGGTKTGANSRWTLSPLLGIGSVGTEIARPIINALAALPVLELRSASVTSLAATGAIGNPSAGALAEVA